MLENRPYVAPPNMLCLLPNTAVRVDVRHPHPCGGWYTFESWCYGPHGRIGYYHGADISPTPE